MSTLTDKTMTKKPNVTIVIVTVTRPRTSSTPLRPLTTATQSITSSPSRTATTTTFTSAPSTTSANATDADAEAGVDDTNPFKNPLIAVAVGAAIGLIVLFFMALLYFLCKRRRRGTRRERHKSRRAHIWGNQDIVETETDPIDTKPPTLPPVVLPPPAKSPSPAPSPRPPTPTTPTPTFMQLYTVIRPHTPTHDDELVLTSGQLVSINQNFDDGWSQGVNISTGEEGVFPASCVVKREREGSAGTTLNEEEGAQVTFEDMLKDGKDLDRRGSRQG
ncbi:hypothetical protein HDV00_004813 [Rhizophlyctis rosea]|nr:hypothetical protein HDV00_004813 [Rhizophlyctis rosea]